MSTYDPHRLGDQSQRCGNPNHPEHVARTCEQYEVDELGIKPVPWEWRAENLLRLEEVFGNDWHGIDAFHVRSKASSDQTLRAFQEAGGYQGLYTGTGTRCREIGRNKDVQDVIRRILLDHHAVDSDALDFIDPRLPVAGSCVSPQPMPFDEGNPDHLNGAVFGIVAGEPRNVYVLRAGYTPDRWLADLNQNRRRPCAWKSEDCLSYSAGELTTFSSGIFLVAVGTCQACFRRMTLNWTAAR